MKKNDWVFTISVLMYSLLFWKQMPGLNAFLFTALVLTGQLLINRSVWRIRSWCFAAAGALGSSFCVLYYGDTLSCFAVFASLLLASYFAFQQKGSVLVGLFSSLIAVCASAGFMIVDANERRRKREQHHPAARSGKRLLIVLIALLVVLLFFFMYRESSVLFYQLTQKINLDFICFPWIAFTLIGALLLYGFYYHNSIPGVDEWDAKQALNLSPGKEPSGLDKLMSIESEQFAGMVLLVLLNLLLLVVNGLDAAFIFGGKGNLPEGVTYTTYVHQGVGMLIASIIIAMLIILYFFRGRMNFFTKNKSLRNLALLWIVQNALLLFSTAWRNDVYVLMFGLTYKRIGVFIYLLLTLIGLSVTAWKVYGKKTNAFLIRCNSWLFYAVWIIACFVNWDGMIFSFNMQRPVKADMDYMNTLSVNILPDLFSYSQQHPAQTSPGFKEELSKRIFLFMSREKEVREQSKWPSYRIRPAAIYDALRSQENMVPGKVLSLQDAELKHIWFFPGYENISFLDVSSNQLEDVGEVSAYSNLVSLDLRYNPQLASLEGIEKMNKLEYLAFSQAKITDFSPLLKMKNLKRIETDHLSSEWTAKLLAANPTLEIKADY